MCCWILQVFCIGVVVTGSLGSFDMILFNDVARNYMKNLEKEYNNTFIWWDLHGNHSIYAKSPRELKYKVNVSIDNVKYSVPTKTVDRAGYVFSQWYNNTQLHQSIQAEMNKIVERADTFTWNLAEGIKIGVDTDISITSPKEFGASASVSTKLSLDAIQPQTKITSQTYTVSNNIMVSPNISVKAEWIIMDRQMEIPWTADVYITGYIGFEVKKPLNGHYTWYDPIHNLKTTKFLKWGSGLKYQAKGNFAGVRVLGTSFTTFEYPLSKNLSIPCQ